MKKALALILTVILAFALCSCAMGDSEPVKSAEEIKMDEIKSTVSAEITATIILNYETVSVPTITYYVDEISENVFEVTGKVTVRDKYGDTYTGKYDAVVEYDPVTEEADIDSFDLGSLYKD